jgi:hypothetical protein
MDPNDPFRSGRDIGDNEGSGILSIGVVLLAATMATTTGFSLYQALGDRTTLRQAMVNLETPHQQATRLRGQVENIAKQVARLSEQGNPNARELVEALRRQGITINPN